MTYYVSPTGNDSQPGTQALPFATIGHATLLVNAGDTVNVGPGTYHETLNLARGGTSTSPVTFVSSTRGAAMIVSPSMVASAVSLNAPYLIVDGFDVSAPSFNVAVFFQATANGGIVRHCRIHTTAKGTYDTGDGIGAPKEFTGPCTIDGNCIYDIGTPGYGNNIHGMYLMSNLGAVGTGKITNNLIYGMVSGSGVQLWGDPQGWDIINNTIFNCANQMGVVMGPTTGHTLANNRICNNIFYANKWAVATVWGGGTYGTGNVIANNLDDLCPSGYLLDPSILSLHNLRNTDPLFVHYLADGSGDYHLQAPSPCLEAGACAGVPATDYDGVRRPQGVGIDIGAYEYLAGGSARRG